MTTLFRILPRKAVIGAAFAALFVSLFWSTLSWMAQRFEAHDSFYSHGWIVPVAAIWLVWQRRRSTASVVPQPSYWGLALLIPSMLIHLFANRLGVNFVSGFSMIGVIWGLVWTCWGWQLLWTLRFPLLFLLFMVPLPGNLLITVSFYMKLFAATMATHILNFAGMPAVQEGSTIHVPGLSVIVDDTCSGLRSLISLIALSVLWTALMPVSSKRWQKLTVVAASIPIALVANMIRILILVVVGAVYGAAVADGFIHYGSGFVVFGVSLVALAWISQAFHPLTREGKGIRQRSH